MLRIVLLVLLARGDSAERQGHLVSGNKLRLPKSGK